MSTVIRFIIQYPSNLERKLAYASNKWDFQNNKIVFRNHFGNDRTDTIDYK